MPDRTTLPILIEEIGTLAVICYYGFPLRNSRSVDWRRHLAIHPPFFQYRQLRRRKRACLFLLLIHNLQLLFFHCPEPTDETNETENDNQPRTEQESQQCNAMTLATRTKYPTQKRRELPMKCIPIKESRVTFTCLHRLSIY